MLRSLLAACLMAGAAAAFAQDAFQPGKHYEGVSPAVATHVEEGKVEVLELFWYGCPHCYAFEPELSKWLESKADYIEFVRVPAVFARNWEIHARAYYAAEQLGVLEQTHPALFEALHRERRRVFSVDELAGFFAEHGVDESAFRAAYDSFDVDTKTRRAVKLTREYGITGVPAVIIDGRYRTSTQKTGDFETLLKVVDALAAKQADR